MGDLAYPLVSDLKREITQKYNVLTSDGVALRGLFIIDKEVGGRPPACCLQFILESWLYSLPLKSCCPTGRFWVCRVSYPVCMPSLHVTQCTAPRLPAIR